MEEDIRLHTLSNGLRIAYKQFEATRIAHCGITIQAGSRDELESEFGLAHLLEHMLFKGTTKRKSYQILNRLEVVGGELNAFTSKDKTCIYAMITDEYVERALELLSDITFNSTFPEKELIKEKKVIFDEMDMYLDSPEERILDEFQELFYPNHPLGTNILGSKESLKDMHSSDLKKFRDRHYQPGQMVFSFVGRLSFEKVIRLCEKFLNVTVPEVMPLERKPFEYTKHFTVRKKLPFVQAHVLLGSEALPLSHPDRPALMLLTNILAGPGMNSLLNVSLREKYGYTYGVESSYQTFSDTGLLHIYWSTDIQNLNHSLKIVHKSLKALIDKPMAIRQFNTFKTQFIGQLIMAEENRSGMMTMMGRSLLDSGKIDTLEEVLHSIERIHLADIQRLAESVLSPDKLSTLIYEPE